MMTAPPIRTCSQALDEARALGLDRLDAQLLLLHALGKPAGDRAWLLAHDTDPLPPAAGADFHALCLRRAAGEPLAYIVGSKEFFGLQLQVDKRVLVPRPDTETLVQWSLDVLELPGIPTNPEILDLGTGSGAVALAIAHGLQPRGSGRITAVDASADALEVARGNAERLQIDAHFIQSDWLTNVDGHFHLIASNPPYIADADSHLAALTHEPTSALVAGSDGLDDIRKIVTNAPAHLQPGGWVLLEHGYDQAAAVRELLTTAGFVEVSSRQDLSGIERCSGGQWPLGRQHNTAQKTAG